MNNLIINKRRYLIQSLESTLYLTILKRNILGTAVSSTYTQREMLRLYTNHPNYSTIESSLQRPFKASYKWLKGFMKRWNLTRRQFTTRRTRPPPQSVIQQLDSTTDPKTLISAIGSTDDKVQERLNNFYDFIQEKEYLDSGREWWNMDETPMWLDMPTTHTFCPIGVNSIPLQTTGQEKT